MTTILLHPGFHKTGTSSVQHFLWSNRDALSPHVTPVMLRHLKPVVRMACRFSRSTSPVDLLDLVPALDAALAEAGVRPGQGVVVSCEGLLGHLPGWPDVDRYDAAPTLVALLCAYFEERHPDARLQILLTTRDADSWLFSAYRHHLRGHRLTSGPADFADRFAAAADLTGVAADVAAAVGDVPVATLALDDMRQHPLGPGGAVCDLLDLSDATRAALRPVGQGNAGPDEGMWHQFLDLNRSQLSDKAVQAEKARLAETADLGGWRRV